MDKNIQTEIEAAVFRQLIKHFGERTDVQNIDLMNLSGFCRNCLSKWYSAAAEEHGQEVDYEQAREIVYGMPYAVCRMEIEVSTGGNKRTAGCL